MLHSLELRSTPPLRVYVLCLILILGNIALASFTREYDVLGRVSHFYFGTVFTPIESEVANVREQVAALIQGVAEFKSLQEQLASARAQVAEKSSDSIKLSELQRETEQLRRLLSFRATRPENFFGARVLRWNYGPFSQTVQIDRGSDVGVKVGSPVVTYAGVVGQVVGVGAASAEVMVLSDALSAVDVLTEDKRVHGIVTGVGNRQVELAFISAEESGLVTPGARLVTSGLDGIFPKSLFVGVVRERLSSSDSLFVSFRVDLSVDLLRLEEVLVQQ